MLFHGLTGCGAANLRFPTGGSAYGMPLKLNIDLSCFVWVILPLISPKKSKLWPCFYFALQIVIKWQYTNITENEIKMSHFNSLSNYWVVIAKENI